MRRRTILRALLLSAAANAAFLAIVARADDAPPGAGTEISFELQDVGGRTIRTHDLRGRWLLVFFGYTSCPDLCPTVLAQIGQALAKIGPMASRVQPIFVSFDTQRDTPQMLQKYVLNFEERILPLTGTEDQILRSARSFGVTFFKIPGASANDYTFAHSSFLTLLGPEGGLVTRFSTDIAADEMAMKLRKLIATSDGH